MRPLSVVIPTLNESRSLPLLLADLARWPWSMQLLVVDGGSRDATVSVAHLAGAEVLSSPERGRGQQLCLGSANARETWLLVLHADSRLHPQWPEAVSKVINDPDNASQAWTFDFQVEGDRLMLRMLERAKLTHAEAANLRGMVRKVYHSIRVLREREDQMVGRISKPAGTGEEESHSS